ncbi:MAG TPA: hypothetical protein DHW40_02915 [Microbacterium sp.]|nr:hypothetical protein [Microbacterium sp.]
MDDPAASELTRLRERAYGAHADIATDPHAQARLAELEAQQRADREPKKPAMPAAPAPSRAATAPPPASAEPLPTQPSLTVTPSSNPPPVSPRVRTALRALTWAGSLAAVAAIAVGVTAAVTARTAWPAVGGAADPRISYLTALDVDENGEVPEMFFGNGLDTTVFASFEGVTAYTFTYEERYSDATCVMVIASDVLDDPNPTDYDGLFAQGCSTGAFAPAATMVVSEGSPQALQDRFPRGTSLQFVLNGETVDVFAADPPPPAEV